MTPAEAKDLAQTLASTNPHEPDALYIIRHALIRILLHIAETDA